jgi:serine/threonine protein kinase
MNRKTGTRVVINQTKRAVDLLLGACFGSVEAHSCGIVHRDISLENLVVLKGPHGVTDVKVIDFGPRE